MSIATTPSPDGGRELMMIRFSSKAGPSITMMDRHALPLIRMMHHSGTVPSAILPDDLPSALQSLKSSLDTLGHDQGDEPPAEDAAGDSDEDSDRVALHTRAYPLLQLLESAVRDEQAVMWDYYDGSYI